MNNLPNTATHHSSPHPQQWDAAYYASLLPSIPANAHKYTRGNVLVLAGSARFPGAAILAAQAAARAGAGYVTLAIPAPAAPVAQAHLLSIPVIQAPADTTGSFAPHALPSLLAAVTHVDAIILGPGLTVTPGTTTFVQTVLTQTTAPLLIDADALTILAHIPLLSFLAQGAENLCPQSDKPSRSSLVLTPHAGELARLYAATSTNSPTQLARATGAIVVAKGPTTTVASASRTVLLAYGTPALATAGTGDVLSGIIGSFMAQGVAPFDAATLGVYLHSMAGRAAEQHLGTRSVMAEDVLAHIPSVLRALEQSLSPAFSHRRALEQHDGCAQHSGGGNDGGDERGDKYVRLQAAGHDPKGLHPQQEGVKGEQIGKRA